MIECVAAMPHSWLRAVALLPDQGDHAPGGADADHVEDDRLERQQQRAEGPGQEQEGEHGDQRDHHREAAVDGRDEVLVLGPDAADADAGAEAVGGGCARGRSCPARVGGGVRDDEGVDDRRARARCHGRPGRSDGAVHRRPPRRRPSPTRSAAGAGASISIGVSAPAPMPERSSATRPACASPCLAQRVDVGRPGLQAGGGDRRARRARRRPRARRTSAGGRPAAPSASTSGWPGRRSGCAASPAADRP